MTGGLILQEQSVEFGLGADQFIHRLRVLPVHLIAKLFKLVAKRLKLGLPSSHDGLHFAEANHLVSEIFVIGAKPPQLLSKRFGGLLSHRDTFVETGHQLVLFEHAFSGLRQLRL